MNEETHNHEQIYTNGGIEPPEPGSLPRWEELQIDSGEPSSPAEPVIPGDIPDPAPETAAAKNPAPAPEPKAEQKPEQKPAQAGESAPGEAKPSEGGVVPEELLAAAKQETKKGKPGKKKKKKKVSITNILLVLIMLTGVGVLAYPTVSDWWNSRHATQAIAGYVEAVESMSKEDKEAIFAKAKEYNESLPNGVNFNIPAEKYAEYASILDITGTGIMGYIQIDSIGVNLPVYHGVDEGVLQIAAGHIPGSSFPIGGERTHAIMSGHRGLPSAKLFTDLDKLGEGDVFTVTVLDETFTYMVDQIRIVLPEETDELAIVDGKEYATLVTCTPYGVNSHRILMRGHRIANIEGKATPAEAVKIPTYIVIPAVGIPLLFIVLALMLIYYRRKKPGKSTKDILDDIRKS